MTYEPKNYDRLLGTAGFSDALLKNHFTLYQGYVKNTNLLGDELRRLREEGKTALPAFAELRRRFGWEFNGMRLHEYYFENMVRGGSALNPTGLLAERLSKDFGSVENWRTDFLGAGAGRGIGWVVLAFDSLAGKTFNVWINEHDGGFPAGTIPLIVMDVFEHAFMLDYGLKRADYLTAFLNVLDWSQAEKRLKACS